MPSAEPNNPPSVGPTISRSLAITGMKYWIGKTNEFMMSDMESTPSTIRLLMECPSPSRRLRHTCTGVPSPSGRWGSLSREIIRRDTASRANMAA